MRSRKIISKITGNKQLFCITQQELMQIIEVVSSEQLSLAQEHVLLSIGLDMEQDDSIELTLDRVLDMLSESPTIKEALTV